MESGLPDQRTVDRVVVLRVLPRPVQPGSRLTQVTEIQSVRRAGGQAPLRRVGELIVEAHAGILCRLVQAPIIRVDVAGGEADVPVGRREPFELEFAATDTRGTGIDGQRIEGLAHDDLQVLVVGIEHGEVHSQAAVEIRPFHAQFQAVDILRPVGTRRAVGGWPDEALVESAAFVARCERHVAERLVRKPVAQVDGRVGRIEVQLAVAEVEYAFAGRHRSGRREIESLELRPGRRKKPGRRPGRRIAERQLVRQVGLAVFRVPRADRQRQPVGEVECTVGKHRVGLVVVEAAALDGTGRYRDVHQVEAGLVVVEEPEHRGKAAQVARELQLQFLAELFVLVIVARRENVGRRVVTVPGRKHGHLAIAGRRLEEPLIVDRPVDRQGRAAAVEFGCDREAGFGYKRARRRFGAVATGGAARGCTGWRKRGRPALWRRVEGRVDDHGGAARKDCIAEGCERLPVVHAAGDHGRAVLVDHGVVDDQRSRDRIRRLPAHRAARRPAVAVAGPCAVESSLDIAVTLQAADRDTRCE